MRIDFKNLTAHNALVRISFWAILLVALAPVLEVQAVGPVLGPDCTITWHPNGESDLAGYRVYVGRAASALALARDVGVRHSIRCSEMGTTADGQWVAAVTAYDSSGNESPRSLPVPFVLTGMLQPIPPAQIKAPTDVQLVLRAPGVLLVWQDQNLPRASYRIETASSTRPNWTTLAVQPSGLMRFAYFQPMEAEWACYRVRAEIGSAVSDWARDSGPADGQFCFRPAKIPLLTQPLLASSIMPEPLSVRLTALNPGFELSWGSLGANPFSSVRLEVSSSVQPNWSALAVLPAGAVKFAHDGSIDADWVCVRIRSEVGRFVSLWAAADGLNDRQFCYAPEF